MSIDNLYTARILADTLGRAKHARAHHAAELDRIRAGSDDRSPWVRLLRIGRRQP